MDQAEFILMTEQPPGDYRPGELSQIIFCFISILSYVNNCAIPSGLRTYCSMSGSAYHVRCILSGDRAKILQVISRTWELPANTPIYILTCINFNHSVLLKHLKKFIVSIDGGFQVIRCILCQSYFCPVCTYVFRSFIILSIQTCFFSHIQVT